MSRDIGGLIGALVVIGLLSRLALIFIKGVDGWVWRVATAHLVVYGIAVVLAGFGNANGGPWAPGSSVWVYAVGSVLWATFDLRGLIGKGPARRA